MLAIPKVAEDPRIPVEESLLAAAEENLRIAIEWQVDLFGAHNTADTIRAYARGIAAGAIPTPRDTATAFMFTTAAQSCVAAFGRDGAAFLYSRLAEILEAQPCPKGRF